MKKTKIEKIENSVKDTAKKMTTGKKIQGFSQQLLGAFMIFIVLA
jgi:hypothetical protein